MKKKIRSSIIILICLWIVVSTFVITVKHLAMANGLWQCGQAFILQLFYE